MSSPRAVVEQLYQRFIAHDGAGMAACYAEEATFTDEVFVGLRGRQVGGMWRMLTARAGDLVVVLDELKGIDAIDGAGDQLSARWTARYTFSATGRKVVNVITSTITVRDGLIVDQRDRFDLGAWISQAMGPVMGALGWTGLPRWIVRRAARRNLERFLSKES